MNVRIGTRSSRLAMWQTVHVAEALRAARPGLAVSVVEMSTRGDEVHSALPEIGGEGVFTERIERALLEGDIDIAVHSLKDLPVEPRPELSIGAVLDRQEVREVLVSRSGVSLSSLPPGAVVGSSSTRRSAQLHALRPDLVVRPIRGNVETRIAKVESGLYDATLLAGAGVTRLGLADRISEWLPLADFLPAPGQGALAVQCRAADAAVIALLQEIDEPTLHAATDAERHFLGLLECGCSAPVAAFAEPQGTVPQGAPSGPSRGDAGDGVLLYMRVRVSAPDGSSSIAAEASGRAPRALAAALAARVKAAGADAILASLRTRKGNAASTEPVAGPGQGTARGLEGMRILVTRAREQAAGLCAQLEARGAVPVLLPMIRIAPLPTSPELLDAVRALDSYDWVVFTSANSVDAFFHAAQALGGAAVFTANGPSAAAVGPATAEALSRWGVTPSFVPVDHDAATLAAALGGDVPEEIAGARILYPRAQAVREDAVESLRRRGAVVNDIPVYRTVPADVTEPELRTALSGGLDAILFMSGSAVHAFCDTAREAERLAGAARDAVVGCMGMSTAEAARARGLAVHVQPSENTAEALIDALTQYMARRGQGGS